MKRFISCLSALAVLMLLITTTQAVTIDTVLVGNPGNTGEQSRTNDASYYGSVADPYLIGKCEVTAGQYTEFLNAVAGVDNYGLWSGSIASKYACKIERYDGNGTEGNPYRYQVAPDLAKRPVDFVSWGDAARFCNWLHNGQPTGQQDLTTTEDGAYFLDGANDAVSLQTVTRESDATWFIPTENEWYKAAYYDPNKPGGAGYWNYPTRSDLMPSNDLIDPDPGNNANFYQGGFTSTSDYLATDVGEFENSAGPHGTFDQGGNVQEWSETIVFGPYPVMLGGTYQTESFTMRSSYRFYYYDLMHEDYNLGFRVASIIPEPSTLTMLCMGAVGLIIHGRRRRK